jgi:branched-chain amino acid aminotransferase
MAKTAPLLWLDGETVEAAAATVPLMSHAVQRGSLVFDVGSFHTTRRGATVLFRAREHVARFLRSAAVVGLAVDHGEDALVDAAAVVLRACEARGVSGKEGLIRWSAYFAVTEADLLPKSAASHVAVAAQLLEDPPRDKPLRVAIFDDARKAAPEALTPEAKVAAAYVGPMLARRRAIAAGADEVVLLDRDGMIAEAPIGNVFAVVDGELWTPPLRYVLAGITRDSVITLAREEGIAVREAPLSLDAFARADEAFMTSTSAPLAAIGSVNGAPLRQPSGPITERLSELLARAQRGEDARHADWSLPI